MAGYSRLGRVVNVALMTDDLDKAKSFYAGLAGWTYKDQKAPFGNDVALAFFNNAAVASIIAFPENRHPEAQPVWRIAIAVEDVDETAAKVKELGGEVVQQPTGEGAHRYCLIRDPQGNFIALTPADTSNAHKQDNEDLVNQMQHMRNIAG
ncbi:VOC family protein [Desulfovibrio inopinatus]|uniref:VOC family protein n=1 Tax=Desulfovibrio inopinatus TaxID=102109 RepID=UPI00041C3ECA|nr:VOC family protein [Desulfovibrio inopinatus]